MGARCEGVALLDNTKFLLMARTELLWATVLYIAAFHDFLYIVELDY